MPGGADRDPTDAPPRYKEAAAAADAVFASIGDIFA